MDSREEGGRVRVGRVKKQGIHLMESFLCPLQHLIKAMGPKSKLLKVKLKRCLRTILSAGIFPPVFYYDGEGGVKKKKGVLFGPPLIFQSIEEHWRKKKKKRN